MTDDRITRYRQIRARRAEIQAEDRRLYIEQCALADDLLDDYRPAQHLADMLGEHRPDVIKFRRAHRERTGRAPKQE